MNRRIRKVRRDDRGDRSGAAAVLGRLGYRYRSELMPMSVAGGLFVTAAILHRQHVASCWVTFTGLVVGAGLCWPRIVPRLRPVERGYAVALVLAATGWLTTAKPKPAATKYSK